MQPLYLSPFGLSLQCDLCPRRCNIYDKTFGACKVRGNSGMRGNIPFAGYLSGTGIDPIEKKPLYHFRPGTTILSAGFTGCNMRCPFCQNWRISQGTDSVTSFVSPAELISGACRTDPPQIAYTYSEPLVHIEYLLACMKEARQRGVANVLVTNGCISAEAAKEVLSLTDAANIDLKSFSEEVYSNILGGDLKTVTDFIKLAIGLEVHTEITTLVVPDLNSSAGELDRIASFIADLSKDIPWHLSAYHPAWRHNAPPTDPERLLRAAERGQKKLNFVYTGNITASSAYSDTRCSRCGTVIVSRTGFKADTSSLLLKSAEGTGKQQYYCAKCGGPAPFRY